MLDKRLKNITKRVKDEFDVSLEDTSIEEIVDPVPILRFMVNTSMNWHHKDYDAWAIGKQLQMTLRGKIPYKTELEVSAGLWHLINTGQV